MFGAREETHALQQETETLTARGAAAPIFFFLKVFEISPCRGTYFFSKTKNLKISTSTLLLHTAVSTAVSRISLFISLSLRSGGKGLLKHLCTAMWRHESLMCDDYATVWKARLQLAHSSLLATGRGTGSRRISWPFTTDNTQ